MSTVAKEKAVPAKLRAKPSRATRARADSNDNGRVSAAEKPRRPIRVTRPITQTTAEAPDTNARGGQDERSAQKGNASAGDNNKSDEPVFRLAARIREIFTDGDTADARMAATIVLTTEQAGFFDALSYEERESIISHYAHSVRQTMRRTSIRGSRTVVHNGRGSTESVMRLTLAGPTYWSTIWPEVGGKQTRELTAHDIDRLIQIYKARSRDMLLRVRWLIESKKLAEQHNARTLGDLEKKGISLPDIEVHDDDDRG